MIQTGTVETKATASSPCRLVRLAGQAALSSQALRFASFDLGLLALGLDLCVFFDALEAGCPLP